MKTFHKSLAQLNPAQRQAVDTIEGPVLVVAGPGTGKTQLLGMRAAAIVHRTDTLPQNILCLTFTESAALAMRQRLVALMGSEGNKVAVHTFHSFGTEIIDQNPQHFYNGARFTPADEMASYQVLQQIFTALPHNNPLGKTMNGEFTALGDTQAAISHLKRAGLLPSELLAVLDHNHAFYEFAEPILAPLFASRLSKASLPIFMQAFEQLASHTSKPTPFSFIKPVAAMCTSSFAQAIDTAQTTGKTTSLTAWRNTWLEKDKQDTFVFKDRLRAKKLRALAHIYEKYRQDLTEAELFDFDDMVSHVAHTLETTPELRLNLQEQYLHIMVDEFQDTNGAQLRLLNTLTDNPVNEGRPNLLAVGDDDQAIYAFQGAELNNVLDFTNRYRDVKVITLTQNYRSATPILSHARQVITQAETRLESALQGVNKTLTATNAGASKVQLHQFTSTEAEYQWVTHAVQTAAAKGTELSDIAVIARHHKQLVELLPHLHAAGIATHYERHNNALDNPRLTELIMLAEVVMHIGEGEFDHADAHMPELLSYDFWQLKTSDIWQLSLKAYKEQRMWLELMLEDTNKLRAIAEFLIVASQQALHKPFDIMLDVLIGASETQAPNDEFTEPQPPAPNGPSESFTSPLRAYYFSEQRLKQEPQEYLAALSALRAVRQAWNNYQTTTPGRLRDFLEFVELHRRTNTPIVDTTRHIEATQGVCLLSAHKAKGLEFNTVFVLNCQDDVWGRRARHRSSQLSFPRNLPLEPAGSTYDDALRLFFVAITRAKQHLNLTWHIANNSGKPTMLAEFLQPLTLPTKIHPDHAQNSSEQLAPGWATRHLSLPKVRQAALLQPVLDTYKLSTTHLNNFIDVTRGGPQAFLLQNLLRFPQAMSPQQVFGHIVHVVLQRAHTHLSATKERRPVEDILHDLELHLQRTHLDEHDIAYLLEKGSDALQKYLAARYHSFTPQQIAERNFYAQDVIVDGVRLTGAIDVLEIDETTKTIIVIDYKTGKCYDSWRGTTDFDKVKLHKYKQQLMLYKLLVENSRAYSGYTVQKGVLEFVEPDPDGHVHTLQLHYNADDLAQFRRLIQTVWQAIMRLQLPDTSDYTPTYKGVLAFEHDLLKPKGE